MRNLALPALLALAPAFASAQSVLDVNALYQIDDADLVNAAGEEIGDIEEGLLGPDGSLVALVVEVGGFLDIGDEDRVISVDQLSFADGNFVTELLVEELEMLPEWDD